MLSPQHLLYVTLLSSSLLGVNVNAQDTTGLNVKPARCVALRQGQVCYQRVTFHWHTRQAGNYCLFEDGQEQPLQCWQQLKRGQYKIDFQSPNNIRYVLREQSSMNPVSEAEITVAWVYKSKKKPRASWRLF